MRYIELFAGIGGFRCGLEKANDTVTKRIQQRIQQGSKSNNTIIKSFMGTKQFTRDRNILQNKTSKSIQKTMSCIKEGEARFTCVYANEWKYDPYKKEKCWAWIIYQKHFGKKELDTRDICDVPAESIPDHDLLTAGFPCPSYSIAGKRKGFKDPRGVVFFEICRIAKVKRPRLLLLENVKGLLNHDKGRTFAIILNSLSELGYDCEWEVFNSAYYSVPQNRERVFIVGHLRGKGGQKIFPLGEGNQVYSDGETKERPRRGVRPDPALSEFTSRWGKAKNKEYIKSVKNINKVIGQIRRLTPTECERLQAFPDGWTEGISDTQRYKCLGNAVTTNVITEIGRKIIRMGIGI